MEEQAENDGFRKIVIDDIRRRPAMFIGGNRYDGVLRLISNLLGVLVSPASEENNFITLEIEKDNKLIIKLKHCREFSAMMAILCDADVFNSEFYKFLEIATAIAVASVCEIVFIADNRYNCIRFEMGVWASCQQFDYDVVDDNQLQIVFTPDQAILSSFPDFDEFSNKIDLYARLHRNSKIILVDKAEEYIQQRFYCYPDGMLSIYNKLLQTLPAVFFQLFIDEQINGRNYQVCLAYRSTPYEVDPVIYSFADGAARDGGGSLVNGVVKGLIKACKGFAYVREEKKARFPRRNIVKNLVLVCNVAGGTFDFEGAIRETVAVPKIENDIMKRVYEVATDYMRSNEDDTLKLISRFSPDIVANNFIYKINNSSDEFKR